MGETGTLQIPLLLMNKKNPEGNRAVRQGISIVRTKGHACGVQPQSAVMLMLRNCHYWPSACLPLLTTSGPCTEAPRRNWTGRGQIQESASWRPPGRQQTGVTHRPGPIDGGMQLEASPLATMHRVDRDGSQDTTLCPFRRKAKNLFFL